MTHDSSIMLEDNHNVNVIAAPKRSTLCFLRQFARTYAILPGTDFSVMSVN
jgi:hypothetical protein